VIVADFADGLDLDDDLTEADEIGNVCLHQLKLLELQFKRSFRNEGNPAKPELKSETLLINRLQDSKSHDVVDLKTSAHDLKALFFEQDISHVSSPAQCCVELSYWLNISKHASENNDEEKRKVNHE
jgi:hypothetical protein